MMSSGEFIPNCLQESSFTSQDDEQHSIVEPHLKSTVLYRDLSFIIYLLKKPCLDPMQSILNSLEQQHEEEKRSALERQRLMYEHELEQLRRRLSPEKQNCRSGDRFSFHSPSAQQRLRQWAEERQGHRAFITCAQHMLNTLPHLGKMQYGEIQTLLEKELY